MKMSLTRLVLSLFAVFALAASASAQVTTGSLNGKIMNAQGEGVSGASVIALLGWSVDDSRLRSGRFTCVSRR